MFMAGVTDDATFTESDLLFEHPLVVPTTLYVAIPVAAGVAFTGEPDVVLRPGPVQL